MLILLGTIISFFLVVLLIRKNYNFGLSLIVGSLLLSLFSLNKVSFMEIGKAISKATIYSFQEETWVTQTIELAVLMTLIYVLAKVMQKTGAINKLTNSLRIYLKKGGTIAVIPAIYGLLPVPGGALFSAPFVKEEGDKYRIDKDKKNFFNVWFRHLWFPIYPISSNIIIITHLAGISIVSLIIADMPSFIAMIAIGLILLTFFIKKENDFSKKTEDKETFNHQGFIYFLPLVFPLFFWILAYFGFTSEIIAFTIGVIGSIIILFYLSDVKKEEYVELMKKSFTWNFIAVVFGIMIFREIFETSGASLAIFDILKNIAVSPVLVIILLSFILGFLTGYLLTGITLSYVLVEPLFVNAGIGIIGLTSLIFMSAFVGYLISPIHLCNVLSSDYLDTDTTRMYKVFIPSSIVILLIQIVFIYMFFSI
ncbi:MAG: DUF401 family protein [Candidatus Thermoplasmatota archaeon]